MARRFARTSGALAMVGALATVAAGCASAPDASSSGGSSSSGGGSDFLGCMVSDAGGFNDQSFNESGFKGLQAAKEDLGIQTKTAESKVESDYSRNLQALTTAGCSQVVTVGFLLADATEASAKDNTKTDYALVDSTTKDPLPNVKPLLFDTAQASYLAGYAAAAVSKTGTVATYGGAKIPPVTIFMDGFVQGVKKFNEAKGKDVKVLGWDDAAQDGQFTGDFDDVAKGRNTTQNFIDAGADVILPVAGPVGAGTLAAAKDANAGGGQVKVIWVDTDGYDAQPQFKDLILTSVVKQVGQAVQDSMRSGTEKKFSADPYVGTLKNKGVALAPFHDFEATLPDGLTTELTDLQQQIEAGTLTVASPSSPK